MAADMPSNVNGNQELVNPGRTSASYGTDGAYGTDGEQEWIAENRRTGVRDGWGVRVYATRNR